VQAFAEKPEEEFLLSETDALLRELELEFGEYFDRSEIGEPTHEGRYLELI